MKSKNNVDKAISYGTIKDPTFNVYRKGGPVEDEKTNNVINFPIKPAIGGIPAIENKIIEIQAAIKG